MVRQSTNSTQREEDILNQKLNEAQKYGDVLRLLASAGDEYNPNPNVWRPTYTDEFATPQTMPDDIDNWILYQTTTYDDNGSNVNNVWLRRDAVEKMYAESPAGLEEAAQRAAAEERAKGQALIEEEKRKLAQQEQTWLEQQRQAQESFAAELARLDAEMKRQQQEFDDARAAKEKARTDSQVQSAKTQLTALERISEAKDTLVSKDEVVANEVVDEQKTLLERLLKKGNQ